MSTCIIVNLPTFDQPNGFEPPAPAAKAPKSKRKRSHGHYRARKAERQLAFEAEVRDIAKDEIMRTLKVAQGMGL
jgi:hypothetical protein